MSPASDPGVPVSRLVAPVVWRIGALVVLMAAICVVGIVFATQAVEELTQEVDPADRAHEAYVDDVDRLTTITTAFTSRDDPQLRDAYADARGDYETSAEALRRASDDVDRLEGPVVTELDAVGRWVEEYADPVMAGAGGPDGVPPETVARGQELLAPVAAAQDATEDAVADRREAASDAAILRFRLTVGAAVLLVGLSWILIGRARRRMLAELSEPLLALERVVQRMAKNDPQGRADAGHGPKEVRAIARALNEFAEAQSRAPRRRGPDPGRAARCSTAPRTTSSPTSPTSCARRSPPSAATWSSSPTSSRGRSGPDTSGCWTRPVATWCGCGRSSTTCWRSRRRRTAPPTWSRRTSAALVADAVADVRMSAARRGITLVLATPDEPVPVVSDRPMLYRAFLNLLSNAVKFSHDDGVVEVGVLRVGDRVEVAVRDHGIGIPRADLDRLGTRFFRASNAMSNEIAGTGLGLRIVQTIVDKHAGEVVIESAEGEGTTVVVRLPVSHALQPDLDDELEPDAAY